MVAQQFPKLLTIVRFQSTPAIKNSFEFVVKKHSGNIVARQYGQLQATIVWCYSPDSFYEGAYHFSYFA